MKAGPARDRRGTAAAALRVACLAALLLSPRVVDDWQLILRASLTVEQASVSLILVLGLLAWAWLRVGLEVDRLATRWRLVALPPYWFGLLALLISAQTLLGPPGEGLLFLCAVATGLVGTARNLAAYLLTGRLTAGWRAVGEPAFVCSLATGLLWRSGLAGGVEWYLLGLNRTGTLLIPLLTIAVLAVATVCDTWTPRLQRAPTGDPLRTPK